MSRIQVIAGDITLIQVDAIVNAANERMLGGGGVDAAIHAAAGPELLEACRAVPEVRAGVRCPTGEARITPGFRLPSRFVVHTVGPVWSGGDRGEPALLAACYRESLALAKAHGAKSIAFPAISTGVFAYPLHEASAIAVRECGVFLANEPSFERVVLVAFREQHAEVLRGAVAEGIPGESDSGLPGGKRTPVPKYPFDS
jgi:O-acetyl-ADP-ribose deacetylase (regulator of RNase III)